MKIDRIAYKKIPMRWGQDVNGKRFGSLVVVEFLGVSEKGNVWNCICDCGNYFVTSTGRLNDGRSHSCGCKKVYPTATHWMTGTRIYRIWSAMKTRCTNPNSPSYKNYGGRGIKICDEWSDFNFFYADMKEGYADHLLLDREDNDGIYCKSNCKWSTFAEQARNKRNNYWFESGGLRMIKMDWAKRWKVSHTTINKKLKQGISFQKLYDDYENRQN